MAEIVKMPKLSDTMEEGVVSKWHKKVGDKVKSGDLLAEIETDKATMDFESFQDGVVLYIGVEEGKGAPVDSILAILGKEGEDYKSLISGASGGSVTKTESAPAEAAAPIASSVPAAVSTPVVSASADDSSRMKASPLAKKIASDKGIDINQVQGSGDGGRIVKRDVENFSPSVSSAKPAAAPYVSVGKESYSEENVSQMRKVIARRLAESKFSAPHFYLTIEIDMDNAIAARSAINATGDVKISFNDFVVKASSMALRKHQTINSSWLGDKIRRNHHVHIGVAMAVEDGLLVPVVRFADNKSLSQISAEVKDYSAKAKAKKLQPQDWEGNTFTISNLGMFDIEEFTAIINPPDACILAVGSIKQKPVVKNGAVVPGNVMKLTLSCDHRVVDGASGAAFLKTLKEYLEQPVMMLV
ncbi:MAG TPA: pyruvate dehydrogenase complex dihydrolipoamide acetyltransferase [Flavobacteriales bacterium]|nr:pyruvate dehydrogenase complex dihydrolipoamide acetyltransferase [Flavobacteriales bacterium]